MPEMHLTQIGFTNSVCGPLRKKSKECKNLKKEKIYDIYPSELDRACFQHGIAYGDLKDLTRRTTFDKSWVMKHLILLKIKSMMNIYVHLLQWFINFLIKIFWWSNEKWSYV